MGKEYDSCKACFPRKYHAFLSPGGELMPSTIREREGDSESALMKHGAKYRRNVSDCIKVRVVVDVEQI